MKEVSIGSKTPKWSTMFEKKIRNERRNKRIIQTNFIFLINTYNIYL